MNNDGTTGGNNIGFGQADDQQIITSNDRENYIARLTQYLNGDREMAKHFDNEAAAKSGGKAVIYKKVLQMLIQQRSQQIQQMQQQQQQQQQQQSMMPPQQQQQQQMYMQPQQTTMMGMPQQQQPPQTYTMQAQLSSSIQQSTPMMNIKQEPQIPMSNIQMRPNPQSFPMQQQQIKQELMAPPIPQQQQQIKQELMVPPIPQQQQQIKQELMIPPIPQQQQQQTGIPIQQMRQQQQPLQYNQQQQQPPLQYNQQQQQQQPPLQYNQQQQQQPPLQYNQQQSQALSNQSTTTTPQQRNIVQQLQQVRQQNHLNQQQQQQQESSNSMQLQQQQQPSNPSTLPQSSSSSTSTPTTSAGGSSDEILQQILTSPNPPKQPSTVGQNVAQARLRTMNRTVRNQTPQQQQPSPMTPGSDPMMGGNVPSPHSHPGMMQQPQTPIGPPGQSPLARYMMAQSPQTGVYRPQMSPMNMMNYPGSPTTMIDDEMHYLYKYFTDRLHYLTRIITRCQQEGQHDKVAKYRQLHDQIAAFVRNPIPEHLMGARRLKDHVDRLLDPRMFGPVMMPPMVDMTGMIPPSNNGGRLMTNGIFEQCQRAIVDYLAKDITLKYNVAKRFLEPLSEVLNGVPHKSMRLDTESKQIVESYSSPSDTHSLTSLVNIIESEFAHLSMNTFTYELKPLSDKMSTNSSINDIKDLPIRDYELTCRFIEINMPVVPPLKIKLTIKYPNEPPEVLSLTSTTLSLTPARLENSDGHSFFESISRNFIYFLFKLPAQHTITDILDIWRTAIRNASFTQSES